METQENKERLKKVGELIGGFEERDEGEVADCLGIMSMIHLIACGIDVARQHEEINKVDDLIIHPISTMRGGKEQELLLWHVSKALQMVIKKLDVSLRINTRGGSVYDPEYQNATEEDS